MESSFTLTIHLTSAESLKKKKQGKALHARAMKEYGKVESQPHEFFTSALNEIAGPASRPGRFTPGETSPGIIDKDAGWTPGAASTFW
jgi:hypothetical protein